MENLILTQITLEELRTIFREEVKSLLQATNNSTKPSEAKNFLDINDTAELINLAVPSIYGLVHRRQIPHIKRGKKLLFEKDKIIDWLRNYRQFTEMEIEKRADEMLKKQK